MVAAVIYETVYKTGLTVTYSTFKCTECHKIITHESILYSCSARIEGTGQGKTHYCQWFCALIKEKGVDILDVFFSDEAWF
jgi:hypothetical protein